MLRPLARALALLLALAPWPALADITATYQAGKDRLTVEVADNGDARVEVGEFIYVRHGGEEYLTLGKFGGSQIAGRRDDMLKFLGVLFHADPETAALPEPAPVAPVFDPLSDTEMLGLKAHGWRIWPRGKADPAGSVDATFTDAPALAPVNRVLQSVIAGFLSVFGPMDKDGQFHAVLVAMRDKGAPVALRDGTRFKLLAVDTGTIDPAHLAVPEDLLSAEMLEALSDQMRSEAPQGKQP